MENIQYEATQFHVILNIESRSDLSEKVHHRIFFFEKNDLPTRFQYYFSEAFQARFKKRNNRLDAQDVYPIIVNMQMKTSIM